MKKEQHSDNYFCKSHLTYDAISLYAEALALDKFESLPANMRDHVEACHMCRKDVFAIYELIKENISSQDLKTHPFFGIDVKRKNKNKSTIAISSYAKIAAMTLIIISIGIIITRFINHNRQSKFLITQLNKNKTTEVKSNTTKSLETVNNIAIEEKEKQLHIEESELFENLVSSNLRSMDMKVLSPLAGQQFKMNDKIVFRFSCSQFAPIAIKIYDNTGKKISEKKNILTKSYTYSTNNLLPGLYYWKLLREDNLLYVGKFYLK